METRSKRAKREMTTDERNFFLYITSKIREDQDFEEYEITTQEIKEILGHSDRYGRINELISQIERLIQKVSKRVVTIKTQDIYREPFFSFIRYQHEIRYKNKEKQEEIIIEYKPDIHIASHLLILKACKEITMEDIDRIIE